MIARDDCFCICNRDDFLKVRTYGASGVKRTARSVPSKAILSLILLNSAHICEFSKERKKIVPCMKDLSSAQDCPKEARKAVGKARAAQGMPMVPRERGRANRGIGVLLI